MKFRYCKELFLSLLLVVAFGSCKQKTGNDKSVEEVESTSTLLSSYKDKNLDLSNRVVMAPMTRCRADNEGHVPTDLMAEYYAQRASAGLIITEMAIVSPNGYGFPDIPGIYTQEQVEGWRKVATKVHEKGGKIFMQIAHNGRRYMEGSTDVIAPSALPYKEGVIVPKAMTKAQIKQIASDFAVAAQNAINAGFDGVEIHGANGYLISEFLSKSSNIRTDEYGGSIENRSRFLFDVLDSVAARIDISKVAIRISPSLNEGGIVDDAETQPLHEFVVNKLNSYNLAYLHISGRADKVKEKDEQDAFVLSIAKHYRSLYKGTYIISKGFTKETAEAAIKDGVADLVSFGHLYISNPDLVERFREGYPLAEADPKTFMAKGATGYTDYPFYQKNK